MTGQNNMARSNVGLKIGTDGVCGTKPVLSEDKQLIYI